jgi:hypothetical protein
MPVPLAETQQLLAGVILHRVFILRRTDEFAGCQRIQA